MQSLDSKPFRINGTVWQRCLQWFTLSQTGLLTAAHQLHTLRKSCNYTFIWQFCNFNWVFPTSESTWAVARAKYESTQQGFCHNIFHLGILFSGNNTYYQVASLSCSAVPRRIFPSEIQLIYWGQRPKPTGLRWYAPKSESPEKTINMHKCTQTTMMIKVCYGITMCESSTPLKSESLPFASVRSDL